MLESEKLKQSPKQKEKQVKKLKLKKEPSLSSASSIPVGINQIIVAI